MPEFSHQENQKINKKTTPKQGGGAMLRKYHINRQVGTQKRRKIFGTDKRKDMGREKMTIGLCSV
jgi:ribosomal protein S19E (S16A)